MKSIGGKTSGPVTFAGPIGKHLLTCETNAIGEFTAIEEEEIEVDSEILSSRLYLSSVNPSEGFKMLSE